MALTNEGKSELTERLIKDGLEFEKAKRLLKLRENKKRKKLGNKEFHEYIALEEERCRILLQKTSARTALGV
jgi:hypothetical protein